MRSDAVAGEGLDCSQFMEDGFKDSIEILVNLRIGDPHHMKAYEFELACAFVVVRVLCFGRMGGAINLDDQFGIE